jgi:polysaccharide pyruvyl transferase WcaK-like protein
VLGTFDVDNYGDHLFPRIARRELEARLPGVRVDAWSPLGSDAHPTRLDDHGPDGAVRGLGHHGPERTSAMARAYDAVLVGGGELLHLDDGLLRHFYAVEPDELVRIRASAWFLEGLGPVGERRCPVLWHGLGVPFDLDEEKAARVRSALAHRDWASVRDPRSAARLRDAGVGPDLQLDVVPDSGLLVDRLFGREELERRRTALRRRGALPAGDRPTLVVQGCDLLVPSAEALATVLRPRLAESGAVPVLLETGRCRQDAWFADTLAAALGAGADVHRVPDDVTVPDIAAVVSGAAAVVASSLHAAVTAVAHRRPFVVLNLGDESKLDGFGVQCGFEKHVVDTVADVGAALTVALTQPPDEEHVASLQRQVDAHFDRLAGRIAAAASSRTWPGRLRGRRR